MHEMGVMLNIVDEVDEIAVQNDVKKIFKLVLEVGELTGVLPEYMDACWPAIQEQYPRFSEAELEMVTVEGNGTCHICGSTYNLLKYDGKCPKCGASSYQVNSGTELIIKEIAAD